MLRKLAILSLFFVFTVGCKKGTIETQEKLQPSNLSFVEAPISIKIVGDSKNFHSFGDSYTNLTFTGQRDGEVTLDATGVRFNNDANLRVNEKGGNSLILENTITGNVYNVTDISMGVGFFNAKVQNLTTGSEILDLELKHKNFDYSVWFNDLEDNDIIIDPQFAAGPWALAVAFIIYEIVTIYCDDIEQQGIQNCHNQGMCYEVGECEVTCFECSGL